MAQRTATRPVTRLCVPVFLQSPAPETVEAGAAHADNAEATPEAGSPVALAHARAAVAAEHGADLVEYRIDPAADYFLDTIEQRPSPLTELIDRSPLPCILTCRSAEEGGEFDGDEQQRISLIEHAGPLGGGTHQPAYIDLELTTYERSANLRQKVGLVTRPADEATAPHRAAGREVSTGLILSTHDFDARPGDLIRRLARMAELPQCRVIKAAWAARSLRDNVEVFDTLLQRPKPTIALCMGEHGLASRVLARKFGALLTFAALDADSGTAPGQPTLGELKRLYRWDHLNADTAVYGVVGHPVGHSLSPHIHNAGFDHYAQAEAQAEAQADGVAHTPADDSTNAVYLPMPIAPSYEAFKATVGAWLDFKPLRFRGASVTIPHKENLIRFVRENGGTVEPLAERIGAANTLTVEPQLHASNTGYAAALDAVCDALGMTRDELVGRRVAVLGAGGAARAIVAGFAHYGGEVTVYNRTLDRAQRLIEDLTDSPTPPRAAGLDALPASDAEVYINCTPIGMHPHTDATPLPDPASVPGIAANRPDRRSVVFDTIYNPPTTRLLRETAALGCLTVSGVAMFIRQGAMQFEQWTGRPAPIERFREVMEQALGANAPA